MRPHLCLLAACSLVGVFSALSPVCADEAPQATPRAAAHPPLAARNFELLPLDELEREALRLEHPDLLRRVQVLASRAKKLRALLAARDREDEGTRKLRKTLKDVEGDLAPRMAEVLESVQPEGLDDALLAHIARAPPGPRRVARYAAALVLYVDGLPAEVRRLFESLLPRYEGALFALDAQEGVPRKKVDEQLRRIERRYWRVVDYVVPIAVRASLHRILPAAYQKRENVLQFLYQVPGLTPSQGSRVQALLAEVQSEAAPDAAAVRRLTTALREGGGAAEKAELRAAQGRILKLRRFARAEAKRIYTPAQWTWIEAIMPRVSAADRKQTSPQVLQGISLDAQQRAQLSAMRKSLGGVREAIRQRRMANRVKASAYGPDSPQMMGMQMEMAGILADAGALQQAFNARLFLELLHPAQIEAWVLAPTGP